MLNAGQGIKISYFYFWGWIYVYNIDCFWSLTVKEEFSNEMSGKVLLMNKYLHLSRKYLWKRTILFLYIDTTKTNL